VSKTSPRVLLIYEVANSNIALCAQRERSRSLAEGLERRAEGRAAAPCFFVSLSPCLILPIAEGGLARNRRTTLGMVYGCSNTAGGRIQQLSSATLGGRK